jgi:Fur family ferric uptake transcriptional regulator/Fur family peroxide stress response transcriptional regulator
VDTAHSRLTPQRRAVLDVLQAAHDHPTAAEVYERVKLTAPGIGAATVYRTLGLLVRTGQALELSLTGQPSRYDANTERHDHLVCDSCGRAVDVKAALPAESLAAVAAGAGFTMTGVDLRIRGLCSTCSPS